MFWTNASPLLILLVFCTTPVCAFSQENDPFQEKVDAAIDRGVEYLKKTQGNDGSWHYTDPVLHKVGGTALAGWTLLESGLSPRAKEVQQAAHYVRNNIARENQTYHISLAILFLHKLGDERDGPIIETLATRLLTGQTKAGGWTYDCAYPPQVEIEFLTNYAKDFPAGEPPSKARGTHEAPAKRQLLPYTQQRLLALIKRDVSQYRPSIDDNSNSQFAMLALFVAGKHGIPLTTTMQKVGNLYQHTQMSNGSWPYNGNFGGNASTPAMACTGLLGIALSQIADKSENKANLQDRKDVKMALGYLAKQLTGNKVLPGSHHGRRYYFLWSLERTAVAYNLAKIEGIDWYRWGAEILLQTQGQNGAWQGGSYHRGGIDTCFALLFLKRANITGSLDLSTNIIVGQPGGEPKKQTPDKDKKTEPKSTDPFPDLGKPLIEGQPKEKDKGNSKADGNGKDKGDSAKDKKAPPKIKLPGGVRFDPGTSADFVIEELNKYCYFRRSLCYNVCFCQTWQTSRIPISGARSKELAFIAA